MSRGITFTLNAENRFTLTCISTGGPATNVSWTRDSTTVITEGTATVLNDPVTARYTHTLTVTGRLGGVYTCTVANMKPSTTSASITVSGNFFKLSYFNINSLFILVASPPTDVAGVQIGPTSIRMTWTPPDPLGGVTGYRIDYTTGGGSSGSQTVSGRTTNSYTLTGFTNGEIYSLTIISTVSVGLPSTNQEVVTVGLGKSLYNTHVRFYQCVQLIQHSSIPGSCY